MYIQRALVAKCTFDEGVYSDLLGRKSTRLLLLMAYDTF
jgi:hypothetical protein